MPKAGKQQQQQQRPVDGHPSSELGGRSRERSGSPAGPSARLEDAPLERLSVAATYKEIFSVVAQLHPLGGATCKISLRKEEEENSRMSTLKCARCT